ncbi:hypothetical protein, partial [Herbiconiux daphne]
SFNYTGALIQTCLKYDLGFTLIARHYTLRYAYATLIEEIMTEIDCYSPENLFFKRTDDYIIVTYGEKTIGIITDLNNATDLKYHSAFLKKFPILIYDEFLAIEGDYFPDEWERLKTIYGSINRVEDVPLIGIPKIFLLGNAVNFSSPLLANLNLYNKLETQTINTMQQYGNIMLEMRRNDNANEIRNDRAFSTHEDAMSTGQFKFNSYQLTTDEQRELIKANSREFYIKTRTGYIHVLYNMKNYDTLLSVVPDADSYHFCTEVVDKKKDNVFLKDTYYSDTHYKKYERGTYLFDNAYSKDAITKDLTLIELKIAKCIRQYELDCKETVFEQNERRYKNQYIENSIKAIQRRYLNIL